ncbi:hypothetical protein NLG42_13885 [Flavobacterium plurextorum]|uniref:Uncharacterized protein n=1 Tax=Flavobacterium quisquiliarum TaxID=1834436 RepID=A0ABV8W2G1_9FLAO|nr:MULTISPECIES: hypothetical protein [Flavobacterium]MBW1653980.1 hypothetical protein [Flavobacterium quisquiliarum]UUW07194.1 hypothetical protein NLG42_13885 [Flavobacterium plurextorum]
MKTKQSLHCVLLKPQLTKMMLSYKTDFFDQQKNASQILAPIGSEILLRRGPLQKIITDSGDSSMKKLI